MKYLSIIVTTLISALNANFATAYDGTINFTGSVTDTACTVDAASANQTVNLGNISSSSFGSAGSTAAATRFTIDLTGCPAAAKSASVRFDGTVAKGNSSILSLSSGQTATNLGVGIYQQDSSTLIPIGSSTPSIPLTSSGTNSLTYIAKYYAISTPVAAGTANATATFTIAYN
ncbi:fimbrial protein [Pantoea ananatis]|uniref:fimbrial protein n=1 Tax=Pantoea ananas TaxID=553 RepID=UPI001B313BFA|nr:fimbrial protein [Pantoea ananatis]